MPGTYDPTTGIYHYAYDDPWAPTDSLLNKLADSTKAAVLALQQAINSPPASVGIVPSTGWVAGGSPLALPSIVVRNGVCHLTTGALIRSGALSVAAGVFTQVATVAPGSLGDIPTTEIYGVGTLFAGSATPVPCYIALLPSGVIGFSPSAAVSFTAGGGATNTVRLPTITWVHP